ncbi:MAG TPA: hypothetical protein VFZ30_14550 [Acidimicrobiales bacterium]
MPQPPRNRQPNRAATELALQKAALAMLERNGVLAGLNLRQVADGRPCHVKQRPPPAGHARPARSGHSEMNSQPTAQTMR